MKRTESKTAARIIAVLLVCAAALTCTTMGSKALVQAVEEGRMDRILAESREADTTALLAALQRAIQTKRMDAVRALLQAPAAKFTDAQWGTLLAGARDAETASALIKAGAPAGSLTLDGRQPLLSIIRANNPPEKRRSYSILHQDIGAARILIENGANANAVDAAGNSPLHYAVLSHRSPEDIRVLLMLGSDPNIQNNNGMTPLHLSAQPEYLSVKNMEAFLEYGADKTITDQDGNSPGVYLLRTAAQGPSYLRHGLMEFADKNGMLPLDSELKDCMLVCAQKEKQCSSRCGQNASCGADCLGIEDRCVAQCLQ